jgi:hypothetical protein
MSKRMMTPIELIWSQKYFQLVLALLMTLNVKDDFYQVG